MSKPSRPFSVFFSPDLHYDCHYSFNGAERQRALWILDNTSSQRPCCYTVSELHYLTVLRVNSESTGQASWCVRGSSEAQLPLMEKGSYSSTTCPSLFQHSFWASNFRIIDQICQNPQFLNTNTYLDFCHSGHFNRIAQKRHQDLLMK